MAGLWTSKGFVAGAIFAAIGVAAMVIARDYGIGQLTRMGSGYFPILLGAVIAALGGLLMLRAALDPATREPIGGFHLRPALFILMAIAAFGLLVDRAGLLSAIGALAVLAWAASRDSRWRELPGLVLALCLFAVAVFVWGLDMPIRLLPR